MFKKIIYWLGIIAAAIGAFILGRGINRVGISRANGIADDIGGGIGRAGDNNRDVTDGIERAEERTVRAEERTERAEELVEDTKRNNRDALDSVRRAKDILNKAKARN